MPIARGMHRREMVDPGRPSSHTAAMGPTYSLLMALTVPRVGHAPDGGAGPIVPSGDARHRRTPRRGRFCGCWGGCPSRRLGLAKWWTPPHKATEHDTLPRITSGAGFPAPADNSATVAASATTNTAPAKLFPRLADPVVRAAEVVATWPGS